MIQVEGERMCKGLGWREALASKGVHRCLGSCGAQTRGKQGGTAGVQRERSAGPAYEVSVVTPGIQSSPLRVTGRHEGCMYELAEMGRESRFLSDLVFGKMT